MPPSPTEGEREEPCCRPRKFARPRTTRQRHRHRSELVSGGALAAPCCQRLRRPAVEVLSRGQQKLVVSALKLAQGRLLEEMNGRTCVYLIDDLPAELDGEHRRLFCQLLAGLECQVFVTCVEPETLDRVWLPNTDVRMFHVEHGRLHTE